MGRKIKIEPKIGEIITVDGVKYITQKASDGDCPKCALWKSYCWNIVCNVAGRKDRTSVIFKKLETDMKEVKIQIPDSCELIKDGDTYVVKEKKQGPPRSWGEFCKTHPLTDKEVFIDAYSYINPSFQCGAKRKALSGRNWITSKQEAEAFLALMQLRQLRKAWVGDWEPIVTSVYWGIYNHITIGVEVTNFSVWNPTLTFPTEKMADDFLDCFRDLCETAKILL